MRLKAVHLTMRVVDALSAEPMPTGERFLWDADVHGLGLRLRAAQGAPSRHWIFRYQFGGRRRFLSLGAYGQPLTIETARDQARRLQFQVAISKVDPVAEREAARAEPTLEAAAIRWIREYAEHHKAPDSVVGDKLLLARLGIAFVDVEQDGRMLSKLAQTRVDAISGRDLLTLHGSLHNTPTQANRTLALLSAIFTRAGRGGKDNPCQGIRRYRERKHERILAPAELMRLAQTISEVQDEGLESPIIVGALVLLLLTGARPKELLTARRAWLNEEAAILLIPDTKEKQPKKIRLLPQALDVIRALPRYRNNPYLFPGRRPGSHLVNIHDAWERIRTRAGLEDVRIYDFRHTYASKLAENRESLSKIGALLGHSSPSTTARYVHHQEDPLREMADTAGNQIAGLLNMEKIIGLLKEGEDA